MSQSRGIAQALGAYLIWGVAPIYFKAVSFLAPTEVLAHRIIWSCVLSSLLILFLRRGSVLKQSIKRSGALAALIISTVLISVNWGTFIWAVGQSRMVEASLGYYINPLVNILLGVLFLGERLKGLKLVAALLATLAVANEIFLFGQVPWVALVLAFSFGAYGLVRKKLGVDSLTGMWAETTLLFIPALALLTLNGQLSQAVSNYSLGLNVLLFLAGPITMLPLMLFASAANKVSLSTLGFIQYIAPTMMFALAVVVYGEPMPTTRLLTFAIIWVALLIYSVANFADYRRLQRSHRLID